MFLNETGRVLLSTPTENEGRGIELEKTAEEETTEIHAVIFAQAQRFMEINWSKNVSLSN